MIQVSIIFLEDENEKRAFFHHCENVCPAGNFHPVRQGGAVLTAANAETYIATIDSYNANLGMIQFTHNDPNVDKKTLFFAANDNTEMYSRPEASEALRSLEKDKNSAHSDRQRPSSAH